MRTQLYSHNKSAYQKVMQSLETADRACVVHPTGTGKSYLIAAVSESFKKVLILGPNTFVLDQVHQVISWRKRGVEYMTYQTLMRFYSHFGDRVSVVNSSLSDAERAREIMDTAAVPLRREQDAEQLRLWE